MTVWGGVATLTAANSSRLIAGRSGTAQRELLAHLVGAEGADVHRFEDRDGTLDELAVAREHVAREVDVVLEAHANVSARERGERNERQLHATDREHGEDRTR